MALDSSNQGGVDKSITLTATGNPSGETFSWSTSSSKVSLSNTSSSTVTVTSNSASSFPNDVTVQVTYTLNGNGKSATASKQLTVVEPKSLVVSSSSKADNGFDCSELDPPLNCNTYKRTYNYTVKDQLGNTFGPWDFWIREAFSNFNSGCSGVTSAPTPPTNKLWSGTGFPDDFALCSPSCPQCGSGSGCSATSTQEWYVNEFPVQTKIVRLSRV